MCVEVSNSSWLGDTLSVPNSTATKKKTPLTTQNPNMTRDIINHSEIQKRDGNNLLITFSPFFCLTSPTIVWQMEKLLEFLWKSKEVHILWWQFFKCVLPLHFNYKFSAELWSGATDLTCKIYIYREREGTHLKHVLCLSTTFLSSRI